MSPKDHLVQAEEGVQFLQPNGLTKNGDPDELTKAKSASINTKSQQNGCARCCVCSWKCCGIATLVIFIIIGAVVVGGYLYLRSFLGGRVNTEDNEMWEEKLSDTSGDFTIAGEFELTSVTPSYEDYLKCFGMPSFIVSLVMSSEEAMKIEDHANGTITLHTITAFDNKQLVFEEGKEVIFPWGRGRGFMHTVMSRPEPKTLFFNSREPEKEWDLTSELVFTKYGMINTRVFVNDNITAKKYYKRMGVELDASNPDMSTLMPPEESVIKIGSDDEYDDNENPFAIIDEDDNDDFEMTDEDWNEFSDDPFFDDR